MHFFALYNCYRKRSIRHLLDNEFAPFNVCIQVKARVSTCACVSYAPGLAKNWPEHLLSHQIAEPIRRQYIATKGVHFGVHVVRCVPSGKCEQKQNTFKSLNNMWSAQVGHTICQWDADPELRPTASSFSLHALPVRGRMARASD